MTPTQEGKPALTRAALLSSGAGDCWPGEGWWISDVGGLNEGRCGGEGASVSGQ